MPPLKCGISLLGVVTFIFHSFIHSSLCGPWAWRGPLARCPARGARSGACHMPGLYHQLIIIVVHPSPVDGTHYGVRASSHVDGTHYGVCASSHVDGTHYGVRASSRGVFVFCWFTVRLLVACRRHALLLPPLLVPACWRNVAGKR